VRRAIDILRGRISTRRLFKQLNFARGGGLIAAVASRKAKKSSRKELKLQHLIAGRLRGLGGPLTRPVAAT